MRNSEKSGVMLFLNRTIHYRHIFWGEQKLLVYVRNAVVMQ